MAGKGTERKLAPPTYGLWGLMVLLLAVPSPALGGESAARGAKETRKQSEKSVFGANKKDPIYITSDRMEVDQKRNTITYTGRVVAQQGDLTLNSRALTAYYDPQMKGIREVVADGQVQVTQGQRVATGSKAVFSDKEQTITLTGNAVVRQGNSQVSGSKITFFIEQDRAVVEGAGQRVKATIFPEELKKQAQDGGVSGKGP